MIKEEEYDKIEKTLYYEPFEDITYVVVGAEKCGAKENPLDIMRRIISRQADGVITETSRRRYNGNKQTNLPLSDRWR